MSAKPKQPPWVKVIIWLAKILHLEITMWHSSPGYQAGIAFQKWPKNSTKNSSKNFAFKKKD